MPDIMKPTPVIRKGIYCLSSNDCNNPALYLELQSDSSLKTVELNAPSSTQMVFPAPPLHFHFMFLSFCHSGR